ncbi:hypothetical protein Lser_V15G22964 [Lactuca serriola]
MQMLKKQTRFLLQSAAIGEATYIKDAVLFIVVASHLLELRRGENWVNGSDGRQ